LTIWVTGKAYIWVGIFIIFKVGGRARKQTFQVRL
jgi:hypothetical protein